MHPSDSTSAALLASVALAALAFVATTGSAQVINNPTFDTDVSGWEPNAGRALIEWSDLDAGARVDSGSALVTNIAGEPGDGSGASQCVDGVLAGSVYWLEALARFPAGQTETGYAHLLVQYFAQTSCVNQLDLATSRELSSATQEVWRPLEKLFTTPALTQSLRLRLTVVKLEATGGLDAHFDEIALFPAVFVDGFEIGDSSAWTDTQPPPP